MTNPERMAPAGARTTSPPFDRPSRLVLVRHGEATCSLEGVIGGVRGCTGLSPAGRAQVAALARRLERSGELGPVAALYSSRVRRAVETAEILAPALGGGLDGGPIPFVQDCGLCELHPGAADGLTWAEYARRFAEPDWDADPTTPLAPGGESWSGFVERASSALVALAAAHRDETVVVATHAGVIESAMLRLMPVDQGVVRLGLRTAHASLTVWELGERRWLLQRYNDQVLDA